MKSLLALYFGTILLAYLSQKYHPVRETLGGRNRRNFFFDRADVYVVIIILWLTGLLFLRTGYNDTGNYIAGFLDAPSVSDFFSSGDYLDWTGNPLSILYRNFMRELTDNYHIYFLFPALLSSIAVVKLCKRYSVNFALSLLIFLSIGTYVTFIAALKQSFAIAILLFSIPYVADKKYIRFYLLVFLAMLFHTHAFMFAILPFLFGKPWRTVTFVLLGATLFAMATYDSTLGAFMEYAQMLGANVAEIEVFDGHSINVLRIAVYAVPPLIALVYNKRLFADSTPMENLFVNMSTVSLFILSIGLVEGANLYARMAAYFEVGTAIALPWMLKKIFPQKQTKIITLAAAVLYFGYFYYEFAITKGFEGEYTAITIWQFIRSII